MCNNTARKALPPGWTGTYKLGVVLQDAIQALQIEVSSLSQVTLQNHMVLDTYIDQSGRISTDLVEIWKQTKILHQAIRDDTNWGFEELWHGFTSWPPNWIFLENLFVLE